MDISWYVTHYNFPDFDPTKLTEIREKIEMDIKGDYMSNRSEQGAISAYQHAIHKLDYLRIITNGKFPANSIWMNIHTLGVSLPFGRKPSFDFFNPDKIIEREERRKTEYEKEQQRIYNDDFHVAMRYFSVSEGYTKAELLRGYRKMCLIMHPDKGGSPEEFLVLQKHYEILKGKIQ